MFPYPQIDGWKIRKVTALHPPTCCMNCELTPNIMRLKCCVFPPVNNALNGVPFLPAYPEARILSKIMVFCSCVSLSVISRPRRAAMTVSPSSKRSRVRSQRGDSGSQIMPTQTMSAKTIWKAMGKRQERSAEPLLVFRRDFLICRP